MLAISARLLLAVYRTLPEWLARNLAFFAVAMALATGLVFFFFRPALRELRSRLNRLRH